MIEVRLMAERDLAAIAGLCTQLGYPTSQEQIARRLSLIERGGDYALFVAEDAEDSQSVAGLVYVRAVLPIEIDPRAEVWALVVDAAHRRRGVGEALMRHAEAWARAAGYPEIALRSNVVRAGAHAFYQRIGYEIVKTSHVFRKTLGAPTAE